MLIIYRKVQIAIKAVVLSASAVQCEVSCCFPVKQPHIQDILDIQEGTLFYYKITICPINMFNVLNEFPEILLEVLHKPTSTPCHCTIH